MPTNLSSPRITIVTPSYNQGAYLEETILSVLGQGYDNLEYMILDGGSTDDSVAIIQKYARHLAYWTSEKDGGQGVAINRGFARATGNIFGWLNSDDTYLPGTLSYVSREFASRTSPTASEILFGNCVHLVEGTPVCRGSNVVRQHARRDLLLCDYIIQPSSFWTKSTWEAVGPIDETMNFAFDWDWYARAAQAGVPFTPSPRYLSTYRIHAAHKTGNGKGQRDQELVRIYERYKSEKHVALFRLLLSQRGKIQALNRYAFRSKLAVLSPYAWKACLPLSTFGVSLQELDDMLCMV